MNGQNYILGVAGRKGSGKSTWVRSRIATLERVAVIDTLGEYSDVLPTAQGSPGEQTYMLAKSSESGTFRFSFLLPAEYTSECFNFLCKAAYIAGNITLVIEEIDYFSKPGWNEPGLDLLIRYARHRNVNMIYTVRNLAETSRRLTSQTDAFVFFNITEPRYLDALEERLSAQVAAEVASLGEHEFLTAKIRTGEIVKGFELLSNNENEKEETQPENGN